MSFKVEILGFDKVKLVINQLGTELRPSQTRRIFDEAGRAVVSEAKNRVRKTGELSDAFRKDLSVYRKAGTTTQEFVLIGPRFRPYSIHGQSQKPAVIEQHNTTGFNQTSRKTKKGYRRGKVGAKDSNPVLEAWRFSGDKVNAGIQNGLKKIVDKIKAEL